MKDRKVDFLQISVVVLAAAGFIATQLLMVATEPYGRDRAGVALVPAINAELTADMPIYMVGMYDQTLPYYMQRTVTLVQHADEMEFGIEQEPALWLPTLDLFIERWQKGPKAIAITRTETFSILEKRGVPMRVVASDSRRIVVTNDLRNKP